MATIRPKSTASCTSPGSPEGLVIRVGRWIACPDIETQFAPDNYMGSHSLLVYVRHLHPDRHHAHVLLERAMDVPGAIHAGTDMAPWYPGATPTGFFGLRWVSKDNRDSVYTCLNDINNAEVPHVPAVRRTRGPRQLQLHRQHVDAQVHREGSIHTNTEAYYMWQFDAHRRRNVECRSGRQSSAAAAVSGR